MRRENSPDEAVRCTVCKMPLSGTDGPCYTCCSRDPLGTGHSKRRTATVIALAVALVVAATVFTVSACWLIVAILDDLDGYYL